MLFAVLVAAGAVALPVAVPAASAIPNTCPTTGPDAATVNINEPPSGATLAGQVAVRGRASATAGLTRVELFVGEALKDYQVFEPSKTDLEYLLRFDVASVQSTTARLSVVACGGAPGAAVRGIASIDVKVDRAGALTSAPIAITPVERDDGPAGKETGPAWVGAAFGLAGLVGLLFATRGLRRARVASGPSPAAGAAAPAPATDRPSTHRPSPVRPPVVDGGASPARAAAAKAKGAPPARSGAAPEASGASPDAKAAGKRRRRRPGPAAPPPGSEGPSGPPPPAADAGDGGPARRR